MELVATKWKEITGIVLATLWYPEYRETFVTYCYIGYHTINSCSGMDGYWINYSCQSPVTIRHLVLFSSRYDDLGDGEWTWWRHQMETFFALLALCLGNSPVTGEFPSRRPMTRSFDVFFDLHLNKRLSKQSRRRWFETPWCLLWRHYNIYQDVWSTLTAPTPWLEFI